MIRPFEIATVLGLTVLLAGPAASQDRADALTARGQAIVTRNCASCHAVGPADASALPPAPAFRELSRRYPIENLGEALAEGIFVGHPAMPEFVFPAEDVAAIISYIKSIQVRQGAALQPAPRPPG